MTIEARTRREFLRTVSMAAVAAGASGRCQMSRNDSYSFQQFQTNGISVRAVVEGTGPLVIMVHGFPELWYSWHHQIQPIAEAGFKVVAPDVRGYGRSDKPHPIEAYDMVSLTNDVVGLIDALGEDQAILFGHDWGAPICWNTAALYPERIAAVAGLGVPFFPTRAAAFDRQLESALWRRVLLPVLFSRGRRGGGRVRSRYPHPASEDLLDDFG